MTARQRFLLPALTSAILSVAGPCVIAESSKPAPAETPPTVVFPSPGPATVPSPPAVPSAPPAATAASMPAAADPEYMQALSAGLAANRNDPEIKNAEAAVSNARATTKPGSHDPASQVLVEETQLKLELALAKKGQVLRPSAQAIIDVRKKEIEARLVQIAAMKKAAEETERANRAASAAANNSK